MSCIVLLQEKLYFHSTKSGLFYLKVKQLRVRHTGPSFKFTLIEKQGSYA